MASSDAAMQQQHESIPPSITVYWGSGSPPCWRVLLVLHEKGLRYNSELLAFSSGVLKTPAMLTLNPRGLVPILIDGGVRMHESFAIMSYLESEYAGGSALLPREKVARATALMRMHESNNLSQATGEVVYYVRRMPPAELNAECADARTGGRPAQRARALRARALPHPRHATRADLSVKKAAVAAEFSLWESYLVGSQFLAGAGQPISLADLAFFPQLAFNVRLGLVLEGRWPSLASYFKRMLARPSVVATWPPHWLESKGDVMFKDI